MSWRKIESQFGSSLDSGRLEESTLYSVTGLHWVAWISEGPNSEGNLIYLVISSSKYPYHFILSIIYTLYIMIILFINIIVNYNYLLYIKHLHKAFQSKQEMKLRQENSDVWRSYSIRNISSCYVPHWFVYEKNFSHSLVQCNLGKKVSVASDLIIPLVSRIWLL